MRIFLYVLIFCLTLSNVASAAMVCCWNMNTATEGEQAPDMPCHDVADIDSNFDQTSGHQGHECECDSCLQMKGVVHINSFGSPIPWTHYLSYIDNLASVESGQLFYPPKYLS